MRHRDPGVVETAPAGRGAFIGKLFEHNLLVGGYIDMVLGGDHVSTGERGAKVRRVQMPADGPISLNGHHGMDMGLAVDNLTSGGHLCWQGVAGNGVRGRVAGRVGGHRETVNGADQGDNRGIGDAAIGGLFGEGLDQFGITDLEDKHGCSP